MESVFEETTLPCVLSCQ